MWVSYVVNGNNYVTAISSILFVIGRVLHSICYIYRLMPWRSYAWTVAFIGTFALPINIIYGAFR